MNNKIKEFKNFGDGYVLALKTAIEEIGKRFEVFYNECRHPENVSMCKECLEEECPYACEIEELNLIIKKLNSLQPKPKEEKKP